MSNTSICPVCNGKGNLLNPSYTSTSLVVICHECKGSGWVQTLKSIKIGKYTITEYFLTRNPDDSIWIQYDRGKGRRFNKKDFEKAIDEFYSKNL